jgi:hypothetical protein
MSEHWSTVSFLLKAPGHLGHLKFHIHTARLGIARDMDEWLGDKALASWRRLYFSTKLKRKKKRWQRVTH